MRELDSTGWPVRKERKTAFLVSSAVLLLALISGCGAVSSMTSEGNKQAAEGWLMIGQNIAHTGQSPYVGPSKSNPKMIAKNPTSNLAVGAKNKVFVGVREGQSAKILALSPTGSREWSYELDSGDVSSVAVSSDSLILVGLSRAGSRPGMQNESLIALTSDGKKKWAFKTGGIVRSGITIDRDGRVYFASDKLYCLNSDGSKNWELSVGHGYAGIITTPAIGSDGSIYVSSCMGDDKNIHLVRVSKTGSLVWDKLVEKEVYELVSGPVYADDTIYFGRNQAQEGYLCAFTSDGSRKWQKKVDNSLAVSPAVSADGTIYTPTGTPDSGKAELVAFTSNGDVKWKYETQGGVKASPVIDAGGTIYFSTTDGLAHAVRPDGSRKWSVNVGKLYCWYGFMLPSAIGPDGAFYVIGGGKAKDPELVAIGKR